MENVLSFVEISQFRDHLRSIQGDTTPQVEQLLTPAPSAVDLTMTPANTPSPREEGSTKMGASDRPDRLYRGIVRSAIFFDEELTVGDKAEMIIDKWPAHGL